MKISVEMKVAAAVGAVFMALTLGAIAQGRSGSQTGSPNSYEPTNDPGVNHVHEPAGTQQLAAWPHKR